MSVSWLVRVHRVSSAFLSGKGKSSHSPRPLLFASPAHLPEMPLLIAAAWSRGLAAFSLPMLLQSPTVPTAATWQSALGASLRAAQQSDESAAGAMAGPGGRARWVDQAAELVVQLVAERVFGGSLSAEFHDVAMMRCDVWLGHPSGSGSSAGGGGTMKALSSSALQLPSSATSEGLASSVRRWFFLGAVGAALLQRSNSGAMNSPPQQAEGRSAFGTNVGVPASTSHSYTTSAGLRCPSTGFDLGHSFGENDLIGNAGAAAGGRAAGGEGSSNGGAQGGKDGPRSSSFHRDHTKHHKQEKSKGGKSHSHKSHSSQRGSKGAHGSKHSKSSSSKGKRG